MAAAVPKHTDQQSAGRMVRPMIPNDGTRNAVASPLTRPEDPLQGGSAEPTALGETPVQAVAVAKRSLSFTIAVVAGFFGVIVCVVVLGSIAEGVRTQQTNALDDLATPFLHRFASPGLDSVMQAATFVGSNTVIFPLTVVAVSVLVWRRRPREAIFMVIVIAGCFALNGAMKVVFERPRPLAPWAKPLPDYSFPSGHSMTSLAFLLTLALFVWAAHGRTAGISAVALAVLLALAIGVSRIYLGFHYFTDVLAGFLAGLLWFLVVGGAFIGGRRLLASRARA